MPLQGAGVHERGLGDPRGSRSFLDLILEPKIHILVFAGRSSPPAFAPCDVTILTVGINYVCGRFHDKSDSDNNTYVDFSEHR